MAATRTKASSKRSTSGVAPSSTKKSLAKAAGARKAKPSQQKKPTKASTGQGRKLAPGTESSFPTPHPAVRRPGVRYAPHPSLDRERKMEASLHEKTGKSLQEWITLLRNHAPADGKAQRAWLKQQGLGMSYAGLVINRAQGGAAATPEQYHQAAEGWVEQMFSGPKATLRHIYDALLDAGMCLGPDVKACPCQTIVPLYRNHVFAQIKPATRSRIDLGFCLRGVKPTSRLLDTGGASKGDRITHKVGIESIEDIDDQVRGWLKRAYDLDA
jgi:hypothetical protein